MSEVDSKLVKELRDRTMAGFTDCKKALMECNSDMDKAIEFLRKKGLASAAKKADRAAASGLVASYLHAGGKIGVLLEVNCETDFVAKTEQFNAFLSDVAMQIAAMNPRWVSVDEVSAAAMEKEREVLTEKARQEGKPENIIPKIVDGQIKKWYSDVCLLEQTYIKDPKGKQTIGELLKEMIAKVGENCKIRRFVRWEVGEGIEIEKKDFAAEIKELAKN